MTSALRLVRGLSALAFGAAAAAQSFDYPNFANLSGLTLNGSAVQQSNNLRVTNAAASQTGSAWRSLPVSVAEGFETTFDFQMSTATEGMAFVIHGASNGALALGGGSWGLGYGFGINTQPITNSLAIELDVTQDGFLNDTSGNELSVHTVGVFGNSENEGVSIGRVTPTADFANGSQHRLRVRYVPGVQGVLGSLTIFLDNMSVPVLTTDFSFESGGLQLSGGMTGGLGLIGGDAWVGFTSATRSTSTNQYAEVRSWSWTSYQLPDACYPGNVGAGAGGPYDLLKINGNAGGFFRLAQLQVADPFTISIEPPPGVATAPYLLMLTLGIADGTTVTPTPWGNACFPLVAAIDIGSAVAPHSLAVPPGIALTLPMTLQAVMATDPLDPAQIELTNAIAVQFSFAPAPSITNVLPASAPVGNTVTVNGNNFSLFATVDIGGVPVTPLTLTKTQLTFAMPASVPCASQLRVRNPDGAQATVNFNPNPTISSQVNTSGPAAGGTTYVVLGTGFAPGTTMTIGGVNANVTSATATSIVATTPPGTPGPQQVVIRTPGGCTVNSTFTYL